MASQEIPTDCDDIDMVPLSLDVASHHTVHYGSNDGFKLDVDQGTATIGDTITFRLESTTSDHVQTGNRRRYTIQKQSGDQWDHIFSVKGQLVIDPDRVRHAPGEGFEWSFEMTPVGLSSEYSEYWVCSELTSGQYRFVYLALPDWNAVAAEFELCDQ